MENDKKDRTRLKSYFKSNAVPTEQQFTEFIDASVNQKEDGIYKIPDGPLAIQSASTTQELIHFYKSFDDANPVWRLDQNPDGVAGFSINDTTAKSKLFISAANGNVGLSNTLPVAKLDVNTIDPSGLLIRSGNGAGSFVNSQLTLGYNGTAQYRHAIKTRHHGGQAQNNAIDFYAWKYGTDTVDTVGTQHVMTIDGNLRVGIGTTTPESRLHIVASGGGNPAGNGLYVYNPNAAAGQDAFVSVRVNNKDAGNPIISMDVAGVIGWTMGIDNKEGQSLKFSNAWDSITSATKMTLLRNGNLGIGITQPGAKLEVAGNIKITDGTQGAGKILTSDENGLARWTTPSRDFRPYGKPSYLWDGTLSLSLSGQDPGSAVAVRGSAQVYKYDNFKPWGNKFMFTLNGLSQEGQANNAPPVNGAYLTLPATPGVHNSLLLSTIDHDRWSVFSVWICDANGNNAMKLSRSANNANMSDTGNKGNASTYTIGPRNNTKETKEHAWMSFVIPAQQVSDYLSNGNLKFIITSGPNNKEGGLLYLSGFSLVPNPNGFIQHPGLSLHWALNGVTPGELTWHDIWNGEGLVKVPGGTTNVVHVKVIDPNRDLVVTFYEHNAGWHGGTLSVTVGGDGTIFQPSAGVAGIGYTLYSSRMYFRPQSIVIPAAIVKSQLVTSAAGVGNVLKLQLRNNGGDPFHFRGIDTEIFA